ncbi:MAG: Ig-like domain-containing protein [Bacilli bacterium]
MTKKVIPLLLAVFSLAASGCDANTISSISSSPTVAKAFSVNAGNTLLTIGDSIKLTANVAGYDSTAVYWNSLNNLVATVDESTGVVTALNAGTVKIEAALKEDYSVKASVELVVKDKDKEEGEYSLEIVTNPTKTSYSQGDVLDLTGLDVKLYETIDGVNDSGVSITSYTTNPANGSYLATAGTLSVVVSYPGAKSLTFDVTVNPVAENNDLVDFLTAYAKASAYKITFTGNATTTSGSQEFSTVHTFTSKACYFEDLKTGEAYGYADQTNTINDHTRCLLLYLGRRESCSG